VFIKNFSQVIRFFLLLLAHITNYLNTLISFEKLSNFLFANFLITHYLFQL
jgi:hypothetical protein